MQIIIFIPAIVPIVHTIWLVRKHSSLSKILITWIFYAYLFEVISLTIFPITVRNDSLGTHFSIELNPISWVSNDMFQIVGNILMFVPLTFLGGTIFPKMRSLHQSIVVSFLVSFAIETTQLILSYFNLGYRIFDAGDLLLNTVGGLIGYGLLKLIIKNFGLRN